MGTDGGVFSVLRLHMHTIGAFPYSFIAGMFSRSCNQAFLFKPESYIFHADGGSARVQNSAAETKCRCRLPAGASFSLAHLRPCSIHIIHTSLTVCSNDSRSEQKVHTSGSRHFVCVYIYVCIRIIHTKTPPTFYFPTISLYDM